MSAVRVDKVGTGIGYHEVLHPPNRLAGKVRQVPSTGTSEADLVARAEKAVAALSHDFADWLVEELERLVAAREGVAAAGLADDAARGELYRVCHDLRGQAPMLGFPLAARVAESVCAMLDTVKPERIPVVLLDHHVDAMRAIVREKATGEGTAIARTLVTRLAAVSKEFVAAEEARAEST
jgi:HPt (histidine-containing phosphotransfer) domain-containing protein